MKSFLQFLFLSSTTLALAACNPATYKQSSKNINQTQQEMKQLQVANDAPLPAVVKKVGYYVNTTPVPLNNKPNWLSQPITLKAHGLPFTLLANRILNNRPITMTMDSTVKQNVPVNINYRGNIKGALNALAAETNYHYSITQNQLTWSAYENKTFNIAFMPGASDYLVGQQKDASSSSSSTNSSQLDQINNQQYSNLHAQLSLWQDLRNTLNQLKSKHGKVIVSESTTSVTVQDRPSNIAAIAQYIQNLNHSLNQQVAIKVQVLEVQLNKTFNFGINWNVVAKTLGTEFHLTGNLADATNLTSNSFLLSGGDNANSRFAIGNSGGSQSLINALDLQGKVRVVTQPQVVTMNNQIASIRITQNVGYIQSVSETSSGYNNTTSSINPGSVTDGFTLYVLPKIQNNKVYMQISSTIASLDNLTKVDNVPTGVNASSTSNTQYQAIEVPTLSQKSFNQRSLVGSGSTLIVAGYKQLRDEAKNASFFGVKALGGHGAAQSNVETLVLITPTILKSTKTDVHINS